MKRGDRKAQVSIFIAIAIIILIAVGLLLYLRSQGIIKFGEEHVPEVFSPVANYVEQCLEVASLDGVKLIGAQGGYTTLPEIIQNNPESYLQLMGEFIMPFWYFNHRNNIPSNSLIEDQLEEYIVPRINKCISDFEPLTETYDIMPKGTPRLTAFIKEDSVDILLHYPLEVSTYSHKRVLDEFRAEVPVRLGRILRLSREIMNAENREAFLEQATIDLMASAPDTEVPFTNLMFSCVPIKWQATEVKNITKNLLKYNLPLIRVGKTNFLPFERPLSFYENLEEAEPENLPNDVAEYAILYWNPLSENFNDLRLGFTYYNEWGMDFRVQPSSGGLMESYTAEGQSWNTISIIGACIQFYHFTYDLTYPVKATVYDEKSMDGQGYSFSFAFPVIVYHNKGLREYQPYREFDLYEADSFCEDMSNERYSIFVKDASTFTTLKNATVSFSCIQYVCQLGETDEEFGRLVTNVPEGCSGGLVTAEKTGYLRAQKQLGSEELVEVFMLPLKPLNVSVIKYDNSTGVYSDLVGNEHASVYLSLKSGDQDLYLNYETGTEEQLEIVNSEVEYDVSVYLFDNDTLIGGYNGNWSIEPADLAGKTRLDLYALNLAGKDDMEIIQAINTNSTELIPQAR